MRELLAETPRGCSVATSPNHDALVITFESYNMGCFSWTFAIVIFLGAMLAMVLLAQVCEEMSAFSKVALALSSSVAVLGVGAVLARLSGLARQVVTLDSEAVSLEIRDWPTRSQLVPRNAIKQVRAWPEPSLLVRRPLLRGLVLRADKDYLVTCEMSQKSILWLGQLLSAWSGAEFIEHTRKE